MNEEDEDGVLRVNLVVTEDDGELYLGLKNRLVGVRKRGRAQVVRDLLRKGLAQGAKDEAPGKLDEGQQSLAKAEVKARQEPEGRMESATVLSKVGQKEAKSDTSADMPKDGPKGEAEVQDRSEGRAHEPSMGERIAMLRDVQISF